MKYLLILAVVLVCIWFWRNNRGAELRDQQARQKAQRPPGTEGTSLQTTEIIACSVCSVHLPRSEALPGGRGVYCSDAHRREAEG